jgi:hypothetical protein
MSPRRSTRPSDRIGSDAALRLALLVTLLIAPGALAAQGQHKGGRTAPAFAAPAQARQFDFLIGQWELTVRPKVSGLAARIHGSPRLLGTWKAWKAFDGFGIEDELRIVDASGNPASLSHALRVFDGAARHWTITSLDVYRTRFSTATAEWKNGEMVSTNPGTDSEGKPMVVRSRFHAITPNSFRYQQDRSSDAGRTWNEGVLRIEAKRVGATAPR